MVRGLAAQSGGPEHVGDLLHPPVVDDDALMLANTAAMLEGLGRRVRLAASGEDALA